MLTVTGSLTVVNVMCNELDIDSAKMLAKVAKQKGISLCGIKPDQTTVDFSEEGLTPPDAILLASDLSQAGVTGSLTELNLYRNHLKDEGITAICKAVQSNKETKLVSLNIGVNQIGPVGAKSVAAMLAITGSLTSINLRNNKLGAAGAAALAPGLAVNGSLTKLSLGANKLEEEGTKVICEAVKGNTMLKDLNLSGDGIFSNIGGSAGAKHVADMLGVNGSLTSLNLSWNNLRPEGAAALAAGLAANGRANGSLTSLDLSFNELDAEAAKALAPGLAADASLTKLDVRYTSLDEATKDALKVAASGKDGFELLI